MSNKIQSTLDKERIVVPQIGHILFQLKSNVLFFHTSKDIYGGNLKSNHSNSKNIQNPDFLNVGFQMVR